MKYGKKLFVTGLITMCACLFFAISTAQAVTFTVTKTADTDDGICNSDCSLREAIFAANDLAGADTIVFASGVFAPPQPIQQIILSVNLPELGISDDLTINGPGAKQLLINGNDDDRIFTISNKVVSIKDLAIINGHVKVGNISPGNFPDCTGGGIKNSGDLLLNRVRIALNKADCQGGGIINSGSLTIVNSLINNNNSNQYGGGVYSISGAVEISNSTISDNTAQFAGGGIVSAANSGLNLHNVTVSHNAADNEGGGIKADFPSSSAGRKTLRNTIVANNTAAAHPDVSGVFLTQGSNLIRINDGNTYFQAGNPNSKGDYVGTIAAPFDPMLGALQDNGGIMNTRALMSGSPAIDKGDSCVTFASSCTGDKPPGSLVYDQRFTGFNRQIGNSVDIGAYEAEPTVTSINGAVVYAITPINQSQKTVPHVTVIASGASFASDTTGSSGSYSIENLNIGGQYIVTAQKSGGANGITAFDATLVLRHVAAGGQGINAMSANQQKAADANSDNGVSAFDATQILRYVAANGANINTGQVGKWTFLPAQRSYQSLGNSLAGENFEAILIGEINGDWTPPLNSLAEENETKVRETMASDTAENDLEISLPFNLPAKSGDIIEVPVIFSNHSGKSIFSYSFDVVFDTNVLQPDSERFVDTSATLSQEMMIASDAEQTGRIGIAAAGSAAAANISTGGTLLKLRFRVVAPAKALKIRETVIGFEQNPIFENESGSAVKIKKMNGSVSVDAGKIVKSDAVTLITGRAITAENNRIRNAAAPE